MDNELNYGLKNVKYMSLNKDSQFWNGFKKGIPIGLGYIPVSFTFGLMAVNGGIPVWVAVLISMTNLTSAGQFAGTSLIIAQASYIEIAVTTFVINIRYMLMSLSLTQKITPGMPGKQRSIIAFGITDEIFTIASLEKGNIGFRFMIGLISFPYIGWALGTILGAVTCSMLSEKMQNAMGIALYSMFIALVIPASKKSKAAMVVAIIGVVISCIFRWIPLFQGVTGGWGIIIATITASSIGAILFPREEEI